MKKLIVICLLVLSATATGFAWVEAKGGAISKVSSMAIDGSDLGCVAHWNEVHHSRYPQPFTFHAHAETHSWFGDPTIFPAGLDNCPFREFSTDYSATGGFNIFLIRLTGQNTDGTDQYEIANWWTPRNLSPDSNGRITSSIDVTFTNPFSPNYVGTGPGYYAVVSCLYNVVASGNYLGSFPWTSDPMTDTPYRCKVSHFWHPIFEPGEGPGGSVKGPQVRMPGNYTADL